MLSKKVVQLLICSHSHGKSSLRCHSIRKNILVKSLMFLWLVGHMWIRIGQTFTMLLKQVLMCYTYSRTFNDNILFIKHNGNSIPKMIYKAMVHREWWCKDESIAYYMFVHIWDYKYYFESCTKYLVDFEKSQSINHLSITYFVPDSNLSIYQPRPLCNIVRP